MRGQAKDPGGVPEMPGPRQKSGLLLRWLRMGRLEISAAPRVQGVQRTRQGAPMRAQLVLGLRATNPPCKASRHKDIDMQVEHGARNHRDRRGWSTSKAPRRSAPVFAVPAHAVAQRTRRTGQATARTAPTVGAEVDLPGI